MRCKNGQTLRLFFSFITSLEEQQVFVCSGLCSSLHDPFLCFSLFRLCKKYEHTKVYSVYSIGYKELWIQNKSLCVCTYEIKMTNIASEIVGSLPAFLVDVCQPLPRCSCLILHNKQILLQWGVFIVPSWFPLLSAASPFFTSASFLQSKSLVSFFLPLQEHLSCW